MNSCKMATIGTKCRLILYRTRFSSRNFSGTPSKESSNIIGFVGLGNMGNHMAKNLLKKGHQLIVYDTDRAAVDQLLVSGAKAAENPAAVAATARQIITMLPATAHVQKVYTAPEGIFSQVHPGTLLIDSSTIDPTASKQLAEQGKELNVTFLDAPVSGGVNAARDATLTFMVGGSLDAFLEAKKLLSLLGKNIVHCGPVGTGQAAKICNNMLLAISMIGVSETMNLGIKLGLDPKLLAGILNSSSGRCWSSEVYNPVPGVIAGVPASNGYNGGFGSALMTKDLGLAQNAATVASVPIPLGAAAHQFYRSMCNHGFAKKDFSSAFLFLQDQDHSK